MFKRFIFKCHQKTIYNYQNLIKMSNDILSFLDSKFGNLDKKKDKKKRNKNKDKTAEMRDKPKSEETKQQDV